MRRTLLGLIVMVSVIGIGVVVESDEPREPSRVSQPGSDEPYYHIRVSHPEPDEPYYHLRISSLEGLD